MAWAWPRSRAWAAVPGLWSWGAGTDGGGGGGGGGDGRRRAGQLFAPVTDMVCACVRRARIGRPSVSTAADAIRLLRWCCTSGTGADALVSRAIAMYKRAPASEAELQVLSTLQQRYAGTGGAEEYATTTLWMCAVEAIIESEGERGMGARAAAPRSGAATFFWEAPLKVK